jgi:hypothetical protein
MFSLIALYLTYRRQPAVPAVPVTAAVPVRAGNDYDAAPIARAA